MSADKFNSLRARLVEFIAGERLNAEKLNGMYDFLRRDIEDAYGAIGDIYDENYNDNPRNLSYRDSNETANAPKRAFDIANLTRIIGPASNLNPRFLGNRVITSEEVPAGVYEYQPRYKASTIEAINGLTEKQEFDEFDGGNQYNFSDGTIRFSSLTDNITINYTTDISESGPNYNNARFNVIPDPNNSENIGKLTVTLNNNGSYSIALPLVKGNQEEAILDNADLMFDKQIKLPKWMEESLDAGDTIPQYSLYLKNRTTQEAYVDATYVYNSETQVTVSNLAIGDQACIDGFDFCLVTVGTDITTSIDDLRKKFFENKRDGSFGEPRISILDIVEIFKNQPESGLIFGKSGNNYNTLPMYLHREGYKDDSNGINGNNAMLGDLVMGLKNFHSLDSQDVVGNGESNKIVFGKASGHQIYKDSDDHLYIEGETGKNIIIGKKENGDDTNAQVTISESANAIVLNSLYLTKSVEGQSTLKNSNNFQNVQIFKMKSDHSIKNESHDIYEDQYLNYFEIKPWTSLPSGESFLNSGTSNRLRYSHSSGDVERWVTNYSNVNGSVKATFMDNDRALTYLGEVGDKAYINFHKYTVVDNKVYAVSGGEGWKECNFGVGNYNAAEHNLIKLNDVITGNPSVQNNIYTYNITQNWLQDAAVTDINENDGDVNEDDVYGYIQRNWRALLINSDNEIIYSGAGGSPNGFGLIIGNIQQGGNEDQATLQIEIPVNYIDVNNQNSLIANTHVYLVNVGAEELYTSGRYLAFKSTENSTEFAELYLSSNKTNHLDGVSRLLSAIVRGGLQSSTKKDISPHSHWTYVNYDSLNYYCNRNLDNFKSNTIDSKIIKRSFTINTIQSKNAEYYSTSFYYRGGYGDLQFNNVPVLSQSVNFILDYEKLVVGSNNSGLLDSSNNVIVSGADRNALLNSSLGLYGGSGGILKIFIVNGKEVLKTKFKVINFSRVLLEYLNQDLTVNESGFRDRVEGPTPPEASSNGGGDLPEQDGDDNTDLTRHHRRFLTRHFNRYFDILAQFEETYIPDSDVLIVNIDLVLNSYKSDRYYPFAEFDASVETTHLDTSIFKTASNQDG